jgi:hypothetical protein
VAAPDALGFLTTRGSQNPELLHIDALLGRLPFAGAGHNEALRKKDVLLRLRLVLDQWLVRGQREQTLEDRREALVLLRDEVNAHLAGETSEDWIDESWGGYTAPTAAIDPNRNAFDEYVEKGGMPADLKQTFLDDYKRIRALLTDKMALRKHFAILEQRMEEGWSLSGALKSSAHPTQRSGTAATRRRSSATGSTWAVPPPTATTSPTACIWI